MPCNQSDQPNDELDVKVRRLSKLLDSVLQRVATVEELQAVTVGEQLTVSDELAQLAERLRQIISSRCTCLAGRSSGTDDLSRNSTAHEEYRPS